MHNPTDAPSMPRAHAQAMPEQCQSDAQAMPNDARGRGRGRELLTNSPSTPTSRNVERELHAVAMDGPRCDDPDACRSWADCGGPYACKPIDSDRPERPVGSLARRLLAERGPSGPVGFVAACPPPEVLVEACARAEYERFRAVLVSRSPLGKLIPGWDDELGWARSTFERQARVDAMRVRLAVLWPVIVEHLGWA